MQDAIDEIEEDRKSDKIWVQDALPTIVDEQIDSKFGDDIGDDVTSWLTEHVTPSGSAVVVDDTLTIAGAAADAKKTGDEITGLKGALGNDVDLANISWTDGRVESDGTVGTQSNDKASGFIPVYPLSRLHINGADIRSYRCICGYDKNQNFVSPAIVVGDTTTYPNVSTEIEIDVPANVWYIRLSKHNTTENLTLNYISIMDNIYKPIYSDLYDGRDSTKIHLTPLAQFERSTAFDPATDMPYNTWWCGEYQYVKEAFTTGSFVDCPVRFTSDSSNVRIEKFYQSGGSSAIYMVYASKKLAKANVNYAGTNYNWMEFPINTNLLTNGSVIITADNKSEYFTDADNAPVNQWFEITSGAQIANTPYGDGGTSASGVYTNGVRSFAGYLNGTLFTYKTNNGARTVQMFISTNNGYSKSDPSVFYFRSKYYAGLWSDWHRVSDKIATSASNIAIRKKMIAPYLDGDGNPTADSQYSSTPNPQYMADDPLIFKDFNDAPSQSVYQIDRDCDASVMANNPKPGISSILITTGFSYTVRHGTMQLCVGINYPNTFAFIRYGYQNAVDDFRWTNWTSLAADTSDCLKIIGRLANNSDLNSLGNGIWLLGDNSGYSNTPSDLVTFGFLTSKVVGLIKHQTIETGGDIYLRAYDGTSWSSWVKK